MGRFVVIEGIDGSGTTSQTKELRNYLANLGLKVLVSSEPTLSTIGSEIRAMLADKTSKKSVNFYARLALLFAADRMGHVERVILPGLERHDMVILDRYVMSSLVYQGMDLPQRFVKELNHYAPSPHLTILLDVPAKTAYQRLVGRATSEDIYENVSALEKMRQRYLHFLKSDPKRMVLIDGSHSLEQVHNHIVSVVKERFLI